MMSQILVLTLVLLVLVKNGAPMTCEPEHPQAAFCRADFVLRVKLSKILPPNNDARADLMGYKSADIRVKVIKIYKGKDQIKVEGDGTTVIRTLLHKHTNWKEEQEYLLSGQSPENSPNLITECHWIVYWNKLAFLQKIGLNRYYQRNCACRVKTCLPGQRCSGRDDRCTWDLRSENFEIAKNKHDCTSQNSLCWVRSTNGGIPSCRWYTPPNLRCKIYPGPEP